MTARYGRHENIRCEVVAPNTDWVMCSMLDREEALRQDPVAGRANDGLGCG